MSRKVLMGHYQHFHGVVMVAEYGMVMVVREPGKERCYKRYTRHKPSLGNSHSFRSLTKQRLLDSVKNQEEERRPLLPLLGWKDPG